MNIRKLTASGIAFAMFFSVMSNTPSYAKVKKPTLSKTKITVQTGKSKKVTIKNAKKIKKLKIKMTGSAKKKATVKKSGKKGILVKGKKAGKAKAIISFKVGKKSYKKTLKIVVKNIKTNINNEAQISPAASATASGAVLTPSPSPVSPDSSYVAQPTVSPTAPINDPQSETKATDIVDASVMSDMGGVTTEFSKSLKKMVLTQINTGDWTKVSGVDMTDGVKSVKLELCSESDKGSVEIYSDGLPSDKNAKKIASVPLINTGGNDKYMTSSAGLSESISGKHDLYFVFRGDDYQVSGWIFEKETTDTSKKAKNRLRLRIKSDGAISEELDLSKFDVQDKSKGVPVYNSETGILSAKDVEQFILPLPRQLNKGETAKITVKGVNNGTKGFRLWLSNSSFGENSEIVNATTLDGYTTGEFEVTTDLISSTASDMLLIKGISYGTFIDDIDFSSVRAEISDEEPVITEPEQPYQPDEPQAYDTTSLKLTTSIREQLLNKKSDRVESLLVGQRFIADPTTIEYNGRLYVYGTTDEIEFDTKGNVLDNKYNNHSLSCISSSDMVNWKDEGEIDVTELTTYAKHSWAPSILCAKINGKDKFFIYYTTGGDGISVLTADSPTGPWTDPIGKRLIDRNTPNCTSEEVPWLFDPGVFVDDDGTGYIYFGGGSAGTSSGRVCKLGADMISLAEDPKPLDPSYYFEDNEINKFGDTYYYSYCTNWNTDKNDPNYPFVGQAVIAYYTADNPYMKNADFGGMVFPNQGSSLYGNTYNNHHHMFEFKGDTYIAYHSTYLEGALYGTKKGYRSLHIDKLDVDKNEKKLSASWSYEGAHLEPYIYGVK
ncbi:MAG: family 43 glycosylhydrolase [Eubacterium sp.]|nr:family 43 glycosylhydrolase [Eubacterium sp.]